MSLFGSKGALSIDFGTDEIKVVEGKHSKKSVVINKSFSISVPRDLYNDGIVQDMDQFAYLLRQGLSNNKASIGEAYGVINSTKVIMREIAIPKVDDKQIASILQYQLEEYLPVNPEDYVVNFLKLGTIMDEGVEKLSLMLIGVPKIVVECHLNLMRNVGLKPAGLDYAANAMRKLLMSGVRVNNSNDIKGTIATIDLGFNTSAITLTHGDIIKVSRIGEIGSRSLIESVSHLFPDLTDEELHNRLRSISDINKSYDPDTEDYNLTEGIKTYLNDMISKIEMIFRYYKTRESGNDIELILLLGGMSNIDGIDKMFADFFDKPVLKLNSLDGVKFSGDLFRYANAIGGLIRLDEVKK